ncbi:Alpha/Beta hydrolase protein [Pseudomassariella vexata]|uniref:Alpha/Beta hydrolase protein n=1 Tax=Pseudomassariella vexata TaxID=1141098 RepID=A0A1Y2E777_9PEZI|nr:Alpha/Beta hydrolase protein [Pseudomassariella vexata]ORY67402.1 Alpha/Beta hydrolase protein [Pseudomassariella vexata]
MESVYTEFKFLADAIHNTITSANTSKHPVSARDAFFRTASYYRAATFFLAQNQSDERLFEVWDTQMRDFDSALALSDIKGERVTVKGPGFDIPVIFWAAPGSEARPTVLIGSGYDASQEESFHYLGRAVLDRGCNLATYEGPGQPTVRRQQGLGFISNWWDVVTPVVDYLSSRNSEVDEDKIALVDVSFGGTLAPLAASREHRLAAVLVIDGLVSFQDAILSQIPAEVAELYTSGAEADFNEYMNAVRLNPLSPKIFRFVINQGLWSFATESPYDWFARLGKFRLDEDVVGNMTCPVFVGSGEDDTFAPGQPEELQKMLGDKGYYHLFETKLGAGEHCQLGAEAQLAQVAFDWLETVFEGVGGKGNGTVM